MSSAIKFNLADKKKKDYSIKTILSTFQAQLKLSNCVILSTLDVIVIPRVQVKKLH